MPSVRRQRRQNSRSQRRQNSRRQQQRRQISRRQRPFLDIFRPKSSATPVVAAPPVVSKAPEVFIGEFGNCNDYLQCLKSGQRIDNCNKALDNQLIPTNTKFQLNKACRQYKYYANKVNELQARNADASSVADSRDQMRRFLETSACEEGCNAALWKDTLNN
jgi:hypothetical protein